MKLLRYGLAGQERPGILANEPGVLSDAMVHAMVAGGSEKVSREVVLPETGLDAKAEQVRPDELQVDLCTPNRHARTVAQMACAISG